MIYDVPNVGKIELNTLILDLNGVLSVNGKLPLGVKEKLNKLKKLGYKIAIFSGDIRGTAKKFSQELNIPVIITKNASAKKKALQTMNPNSCVAIGNARIDNQMLKLAKIGIVTLQAEGIHTETLKYADILIPSLSNALDLLIDKKIFSATMKK